MAYNEALVIAGGVAHVPILITILKFFDGKTSNTYNSKKGAEALAKKKAQQEAAAKAAAKAAEVQAAAKAAEAAEKANAEAQKSEAKDSSSEG